ncbi:methyltransferase domain-containing protein [Coleofasciculus sp. FACHB-712]|uniref:class I SAM-dependent methyltransferase n=1 Tax=Coleofasciculus sp. FACHB-712 TaxID=2692789 RepID=UPI001683AD43|nr:class I SAM-dependent methyltransferase [Coleofasciculus sp. FACHB-712]MBD1945820.1 methyltransferase domain-containing protein [Coleofasciculus sp. FACHB-712]
MDDKVMKQEKIWDYFQRQALNQSSPIFSGAIPRLKFLFQKAQQLSGNRQLRVLNIGVGNGWLEHKCSNHGWETYALDPSEVAITKLEKSGIRGKVGYIENIPYDDDFFDIVFCSEVIEHLSTEQTNEAVNEIARVLKKFGILIGTVPFNENLSKSIVVCPDCGKVFHKWGHQQSFDIQSLSTIFSKNFKLEKIKVIYFVLWPELNWKGFLISFLKKGLSVLGVHGQNENLFFVLRKCD